MQLAIFDTPVIKIESLKTKFDTIVVSNSFVALIGDYIEARIVQQLHYWSYSEYGVIINDIRWIYKPIREWLSEAFIGFSSWQLRTAIASLVKKGILLKEHLFKEHHGNNYAPKNRTYYYSVNYEELEKLFREQEMAVTTENVSFVSSTKQFCESSEKQFCESAKNKTKNTSIENISRDLSHPTLPCEGEEKKDNYQEKEVYFSNLELPKISEVDSVNPKVIEKETNVGRVEENINQNISTDKNSRQQETKEVQKSERPSPKLKVTPTKQKRDQEAPWQDEAERSQFYRELIQALPIVANSHSPQGLAKTIIAQLKRGEEHTYWDDFKAGLPIGTSTKPEWEVEPGVPYPMFIEYLTEKIIKGNNTQTQEQARNEVFRILSQPRQATAFWGQFKRSVVNVSEQVERDRALGVSNPNTPVWTRERIEPSIEEASAAGDKIIAVNSNVSAPIEAARNLQLENFEESPSKFLEISAPWTDEDDQEKEKTYSATKSKPISDLTKFLMTKALEDPSLRKFIQKMPVGSKSEVKVTSSAKKKLKTNISQMSVAEINDYLSNPITSKQIMPQLWHSDYEFITNELGEIVGVKAPPLVEE
ncbi:hypothetical protein [Pleurocapsa sp. PCC 7319]|uniref:hypothetical protein n=1 Tax=Pleurocapsa sp. PCC 7319 TaxID=118161 RepID=UPI000349ECC7|nr:hypothetical protein [Pleurocapsa sp. PCC 7319]